MTSILVTSSASRNLLYWNEPIGWPNALRSLTYSKVSSRICAAWAMLPIALESRSCGSQFIMWMKPWLSSPIRLAPGTRTFVEEELGGVGLVLADLVELASAAEALHAGLDPEQRDAASALGLRVGAGSHHHQVGGVPVGDEGLGSVEDPVVAVAYGGGLQRREVGATGRLGHADGREDLAGHEARQPALALLLGGQLDQVRRDDVGVDAVAGAQRHRDLAELLAEHRVVPEVAGRGTAVLLGDLQAEQALPAEGQPHLPGELLGLDVLVPAGLHLTVQEGPHRVAEGFVVGVVDLALHRAPAFRCWSEVGVAAFLRQPGTSVLLRRAPRRRGRPAAP